MPDFGLTDEGFFLKRFEDIEKDIQTALRAAPGYGTGINVTETGRIGQMIATVTQPLATLWELGQALYDSLDPDNAEGVSLDNISDFIGVQRLGDSESFVTPTARGTNGTVLAPGRIVRVFGTLDEFTNLAAVTIDEALQQETVTIDEAVNGAIYTVPIDAVDHQYTAAPADTETDIAAALRDIINTDTAAPVVAESVGADLILTAATPADNFVLGAITATISFAILAADEVAETFTVNGDQTLLFVSPQGFNVVGNPGGNDGAYTTASSVLLSGQTVITVNEDVATPTAGGNIVRPVGISTVNTDTFGKAAQWDAVEPGPVLGPERSITDIRTPQSGWDAIINAEDAIPGRDVESDQQLRSRRTQSTSLAGSATVDAIFAALGQVEGVIDRFVFQNATGVVDSEGRPPHSVQSVVDGGQDQDIGEAIFDNVSAGIETFGAESVIVEDSQGNDNVVKFDRPTDVPMFLVYNLTLDPEQGEYPSDGDTQLKNAAVDFGNTEFTIGKNVAAYKLRTNFGIPGIGEIELLLQRDVPPGGGDDSSIVIDPAERARFSITDVTVNIV